MDRRTRVIAVAMALLIADVSLPRHGFGLPLVVFAVLAAREHVLAIRRYQPSERTPWYLMAATLVLAGFGIGLQNALGRPAVFMSGISHLLLMSGLLSSTLAFGLFIRARTRVLDRYQMLDLAVLAFSTLTAFKSLVLDPLMESHPPIGISQHLSAAYLLILILDVALVLRVVVLRGERGAASWYLLASTIMTVAGSVVVNSTAKADGSGGSLNWSLMTSSALAVLAVSHPSMRSLTDPIEGETPTFGPMRITALGVALFLAPFTAVIVQARTGRLDAGSALIPSAVVTILVLVRLALVFRREQAAHDEVVASQETFKELIHGISDVITVVDADGTITYATDSAGRALDRPPAALLGQRLGSLVHPEDVAELERQIGRIAGSGATFDITVRVPVADGERVFDLQACDKTASGRVRGLIVVLHDVTERHHLERELRHQASHDTLTALPNRALFTDRVARCLSEGATISVLFVDLDDFKDVNDGLGHHAGDVLLYAVGTRLKRAVRGADTVARLGGDEFAILIGGPDDPAAARTIAMRALELLAQPFDIAGHRISIGASIGLASGTGLSVDDLLRHADVAMYRAKAAGKGTLVVFEPGMDIDAGERLSAHSDLARGIAGGELRLYYQPIFELSTGRLRSAEALVRWQHPTLGLLGPDRFIEMAEGSGLIVPLGAWVLADACREAQRWPDDMSVSVNLSPRQLEHPGIVDDITAALAASGLPAERLILEVTETSIARDLEETVRRLQQIRRLGVRIAIDDFGTGYSSLSSLIDLPVDVLKIDRSFISNMLRRSEAAALVSVLVHMGRVLELDVVAEGIEDVDQADALLRQQCDQGQGFLYSRPVPADAFLAIVATNRALPELAGADGPGRTAAGQAPVTPAPA